MTKLIKQCFDYLGTHFCIAILKIRLIEINEIFVKKIYMFMICNHNIFLFCQINLIYLVQIT